MVESVKPLSHDHSFSPLDGNLFFGERSQKNGWHDQVAEGPVLQSRGNSRSAGVGEEAFFDVKHVESDEETSCHSCASHHHLRVVQSVNHCFVFLPSVLFHIKGY